MIRQWPEQGEEREFGLWGWSALEMADMNEGRGRFEDCDW